MKVVFFGSGHFAVPSLEKVLSSRHQLLAVVTMPDRKKGRHKKPAPVPVKAFIKGHPHIPVLQPGDVNDEMNISELRALQAELFIVIDYGRILAEALLDLPSRYSVNLHPSLLPRYRGASPVNQAILNGDSRTGVTLIKMDRRMDAGDVILGREVSVGDREEAPRLFKRLSMTGADLLLNGLRLIEQGEESFTPQEEQNASYAPKLRRSDGKIDWMWPADRIDRHVRGMKGWPGSFTFLNGSRIKVLKAEPISPGEDIQGAPGTFDRHLTVKAGSGALRIKRLQPAGKRSMSADEFMCGYDLEQGNRFEA